MVSWYMIHLLYLHLKIFIRSRDRWSFRSFSLKRLDRKDRVLNGLINLIRPRSFLGPWSFNINNTKKVRSSNFLLQTFFFALNKVSFLFFFYFYLFIKYINSISYLEQGKLFLFIFYCQER